MSWKIQCAFVFSMLAASSASALTISEVRQMIAGGVEVTRGACTGLTGDNFNHAAKRCDYTQKVGGVINRNESVNRHGVPEKHWAACIGQYAAMLGGDLVELSGIEPLASAVRLQRSPI